MSAHGTLRRYTKDGCRCPACTRANTEASNRYQADVTLRPELRGMHRDEPDPIAVERVVLGDPTRTGVNDRRAATEVLTRRGLSARSIARRMGVSTRTVIRYRAALRAVA